MSKNNENVVVPPRKQVQAKKRTNWLLWGLVGLAAVGVVVAIIVGTSGGGGGGGTGQQASSLSQAPDVRVNLYQGSDVFGGVQEVNLAKLTELGKPVVLNFYAGLCPPCRAEMPELQRFYVANKDKVLMFGVDVGPFVGLGSNRDGRNLLSELNVTYPAGAAIDRALVAQYRVAGMPSTYFITADGKLFRTWTGLLNKDVLERITNDMLAISRG